MQQSACHGSFPAYPSPLAGWGAFLFSCAALYNCADRLLACRAEDFHGQVQQRATGACKGRRGANQQAGGGVRKVSQNCKPAQSPQNPLAARFSECCELLGLVVFACSCQGKALESQRVFHFRLAMFCEYCRLSCAAKINPHLACKT